MTPTARRKNWTSDEVGHMSQLVLQQQRHGAHVCNVHEYRQRKHIESIKLCSRCYRQLPLVFFNTTNHSVSRVYTHHMCSECQEERACIRQIEKNILKRQVHGTHFSDLFQHYSDDLSIALADFDEQVQTAAAKEERLRQAELKAMNKIKVAGPTGLPDVENVIDRVIHQFKKYRKKGKTSVCVSRSSFSSILGYTPADLHAHLVTTATPDMLKCRTVDIHIDHIFPAACFNLNSISDVRSAYALSNLRFLPSLDNSVKSRDDLYAKELFT